MRAPVNWPVDDGEKGVGGESEKGAALMSAAGV